MRECSGGGAGQLEEGSLPTFVCIVSAIPHIH